MLAPLDTVGPERCTEIAPPSWPYQKRGFSGVQE